MADMTRLTSDRLWRLYAGHAMKRWHEWLQEPTRNEGHRALNVWLGESAYHCVENWPGWAQYIGPEPDYSIPLPPLPPRRLGAAKQLNIRFRVLMRDGFVCRYCGARPPEAQLEVDHILPRARGGTDDIENLATACYECNHGKGKRVLEVL